MKKIIFIALILSIVIFCFPSSALGAVMEMTVTITNLQIPERSAMVYQNVNSELRIYCAWDGNDCRINVLRDDDSSPVAYGDALSAEHFKAGFSKTMSFTYDNSKQYSVHVELRASSQGSNVICKSDCTPVAGGSGWYYSNGSPELASGAAYLVCPSIACNGTSTTRYKIAFDPANTVLVGGIRWWRSPSLCTIAVGTTTCQ